MMLYSFGQDCVIMLRQGMRTSSICNTQHVAKRHNNRVPKRTQHVGPTNMVICFVEMLRLAEIWPGFGRGLQILAQQCWDMLR